MTDKEILEKIYRMLQTNRNADWNENNPVEEFKVMQEFIEQEWQRADETEYDGWLCDVGQPLPKLSDTVLNMDYSECQHKPNNNAKDERHRE
jgi:hypothetical protein